VKPVHYQYDPVQTTKTSVHGAIHMLGLAKRVKDLSSPGLWSPPIAHTRLTGVGNSANIKTTGGEKNEGNPAGILAHAGAINLRGIS